MGPGIDNVKLPPNGATSMRPRLVVIEDDPALADLVRELLTEEGFDVRVRRPWQGAHDIVSTEQPNLVLLDLGLAALEQAWRILDGLILDPATGVIPVIVWSGAVEPSPTGGGAWLPEFGVYRLPKPFDLDQLLATVAEALACNRSFTRAAADGQHPVPVDEIASPAREVLLSPREEQVTRLIAHGYSNQQIAEELVLTAGTVANHVAHILDKLGRSSRLQIALWAVANRLVEPGLKPPSVPAALTLTRTRPRVLREGQAGRAS